MEEILEDPKENYYVSTQEDIDYVSDSTSLYTTYQEKRQLEETSTGKAPAPSIKTKSSIKKGQSFAFPFKRVSLQKEVIGDESEQRVSVTPKSTNIRPQLKLVDVDSFVDKVLKSVEKPDVVPRFQTSKQIKISEFKTSPRNEGHKTIPLTPKQCLQKLTRMTMTKAQSHRITPKRNERIDPSARLLNAGSVGELKMQQDKEFKDLKHGFTELEQQFQQSKEELEEKSKQLSELSKKLAETTKELENEGQERMKEKALLKAVLSLTSSD